MRAQRFPALALIAVATLAASAAPSGAPGFSAGLDNRMGLTFSPDGRTAWWVEWNGEWGSSAAGTRHIYLSRLEDGAWSEAQPAPFSGEFSDDDPFVSPDGQWLYFVSERPAGESEDKSNGDIWRYRLDGSKALERLPLNTGAAEYSPVVTNSGALYFASAREGGLGRGDLYRAAATDAGFAAPENLGPAVNSATGEWNLWVSPDESEMIVEASSRPTNVSIPGDLYYSWRSAVGWTAALPIAALNSSGSDLMPRFLPDGVTLAYTTAPIGGHARIETVEWPPLRAALRAVYAPELIVANRSSHDIAFVDLALGEVVGRVATGEGPHLISNVYEGQMAATGYGEFPRPHDEPVAKRPPFVKSLNSRLTVIDTERRETLLDRKIERCTQPHASLIVAGKIYVTCETEQQIAELDLRSGDELRRFDSKQQGSHVLGFAEASGRLAVSNTESGSVTLVDIDDGGAHVVKLGGGSEGMLVLEDRVWIGNTWDGSVSVVDAGAAAEAARIDDVCSFPIAMSRGGAGHVWVACFGSSELVAIDAESLAVARRIELDAQPLHVIAHPSRALLYISLPRANAVAEVDLPSGQVLRRIRVGSEPDGLRWATGTPR